MQMQHWTTWHTITVVCIGITVIAAAIKAMKKEIIPTLATPIRKMFVILTVDQAMMLEKQRLDAYHKVKEAEFEEYKKTMLSFQGDQVAKLNFIIGELSVEGNGHTSLRDIVVGLDTRLGEVRALQMAAIHAEEDSIFTTDLEGSRIWRNSNLAQLIGCDPASLEGNGWISYIVESERENIAKEWNNCMTYRRVFDEKFHYKTRTGLVLTHCITFPMVEDGQLYGWLGKCHVENAAAVSM